MFMISGTEAEKDTEEEQGDLAIIQTPHMEPMEAPRDNNDFNGRYINKIGLRR